MNSNIEIFLSHKIREFKEHKDLHTAFKYGNEKSLLPLLENLKSILEELYTSINTHTEESSSRNDLLERISQAKESLSNIKNEEHARMIQDELIYIMGVGFEKTKECFYKKNFNFSEKTISSILSYTTKKLFDSENNKDWITICTDFDFKYHTDLATHKILNHAGIDKNPYQKNNIFSLYKESKVNATLLYTGLVQAIFKSNIPDTITLPSGKEKQLAIKQTSRILKYFSDSIISSIESHGILNGSKLTSNFKYEIFDKLEAEMTKINSILKINIYIKHSSKLDIFLQTNTLKSECTKAKNMALTLQKTENKISEILMQYDLTTPEGINITKGKNSECIMEYFDFNDSHPAIKSIKEIQFSHRKMNDDFRSLLKKINNKGNELCHILRETSKELIEIKAYN